MLSSNCPFLHSSRTLFFFLGGEVGGLGGASFKSSETSLSSLLF